MRLEGKQVLVFGAGRSGVAATRLLLQQGAFVTLYDTNGDLEPSVLFQKIAEKERQERIRLVLGDFPKEFLPQIALLVVSPGVPTDLPELRLAENLQIPVWGEVELAYRCGKGQVFGITGTNGKTTTTTLLGEILREAFPGKVFVLGNVGNPYTEAVMQMEESSLAVVELSSFQLETIHTFRPHVSAVLNITPDHLNRHHTMEKYIQAKRNILRNQQEEDFCILNYEDETVRAFAKDTKAQVLYFSSRRTLDKGIYLEGQTIFYKQDDTKFALCQVDEVQLLGVHNYENIMAAAAMAICYGVDREVVRRAVCAFRGVAHRIEFLAEKQGVTYYNDSKGTNPDAAIRGICAMNRPTYLIGGGYDKDASYDAWIESFQGKVKKLVLLGATREKIAQAAKKHGFTNIALVDSLEEAVALCARESQPGEAVLLSPACASWGMFRDYEERGDCFRALVEAL